MRIIKTLLLLLFIQIIAVHNSNASWDFLFSNPDYKDQIVLESFLLNEQHIVSLFGENKRYQPTYEKVIEGHNIYLVISVKNIGNQYAWGTLECYIEDIHKPIKLEVGATAHMRFFEYYLIPVKHRLHRTSLTIPKITLEWKSLYSK